MKSLNKVLFGTLLLAVPLAMALVMTPPARADWMSLTTGSGQVLVAKITPPATASGAAVSGQSAFYGIIVKTDGVNNVTLNVLDGVGGAALIPTDTIIAGSSRVWTLSYSPAIKCTAGVYVTISVAGGGTAIWQVQYDK
jgi:hypothetical protein